MGLFGLIHSYPISVALHLVLMVGLAVCFKFLFAHLLGYQDDVSRHQVTCHMGLCVDSAP